MRISFNRGAVVTPALLALALAACDSGPTAPRHDPAEVTMAAVGMAQGLRPVSSTNGSIELACPAGGTIVLEGTSAAEQDGDQLIHRWDRTTTHDACGFTHRGSVVRLDGVLQNTGEARYQSTAGNLPTLISQQGTQVGSLTTTYDGVVTACTYDLTMAYDVTTSEHVVTGEVCGRQIDVRHTLP